MSVLLTVFVEGSESFRQVFTDPVIFNPAAKSMGALTQALEFLRDTHSIGTVPEEKFRGYEIREISTIGGHSTFATGDPPIWEGHIHDGPNGFKSWADLRASIANQLAPATVRNGF